MGFFSFLSRASNNGVGVSNQALLPRTTLPAGGSYMGGTGRRQWNIRRSLGPVNSPGFMIVNQQVVPVGLRGSGLGVSGQYVLQGLSDLSRKGQ
jgi:hypothetical protein